MIIEQNTIDKGFSFRLALIQIIYFIYETNSKYYNYEKAVFKIQIVV
jgi:hypothetical protein